MSGFSATDKRMMQMALSLGRRHLGGTWPNPSVGCVIVKEDRVVGRGVTADGGAPHAETQALDQAGPAANGATAYVTLEPCAHHGRTPPCAEALVKAKLARVVYAAGDPNPAVNGKGAEILRDAGIKVEHGLLEKEATIDNAGYLTRIRHNRPMVTLKLATTLDGKIATKTGESQWITGQAARRFTHLLRAQHDAIMVGSGTALADDPSLTVRGLGNLPNPVRIVLDSKLQVKSTSKLLSTASEVPVLVFHDQAQTPAALEGVEFIAGKTGLVLDDVLSKLAERGITRLFCEGGARLAASLIAGGYVDQICLMQAGKVIGGDGLTAIGDIGLSTLGDASNFDLVQNWELGGDLISHWRRPPA